MRIGASVETLACEIRSPIESRIRANRDTGRVTTEILTPPLHPSSAILLFMPTYSSKNILWRTPERTIVRKTADWYWIFGIIGVACAGASIIIGNVLFGIVVILGIFAITLLSFKKPSLIEIEVQEKGIRTNNILLPFTTLESFWIEESSRQKKLLLKSKKMFLPLITLPIGSVDTAELKNELIKSLKEEILEESFLAKLLEHFGV